MIEIILPAFVLSLSLVFIHVYFGSKIFVRGIIFSDIAIAQTSALGIIISSAFVSEKYSYFFGVFFSALAGLILTAVRRYRIEFKESLVGILYAFSSAMSIIILSRLPEHEIQGLKSMLLGNILFVGWEEVIKATAIYLTCGIFLFAFRKNIDSQSSVWEFLFFLAFGIVVSSSVSMGGVLLVFSYLVMPVFCSVILFGEPKVIFSWIIGVIVNIIGFILSVKFDLPTSPCIVGILGGISMLFLLGKMIKS